ncbi:Phospholipase/carboxylesterase [Tricholoma matsutake]|nr:Phospholipase/carboxylesterase [Tricholoma matsutake 945]
MSSAATVKYTIPAASRHTATVILIHGLGDRAEGLKRIADKFRHDPGLAHVKWILPESPVRKVRANMDLEMPSWFDIEAFGFNSAEDEAGMLQSAASINHLISAEVESGTDSSRIVLGGFSQGATMSLLSGLSGEKRLGGIAVLSGWLPLRDKFSTLASPLASSIPVFWGHISDDPLVRPNHIQASINILTSSLGMPFSTADEVEGLTYKVYDGMRHGTNEKELDDMRDWIKRAIPDR